MLDVAVIIVSWNVRDYLAECLRSVYAEMARARLNGQVWVVDNGSTDGTLELLEDIFSDTQVIINNHNVGFGAANNQGMRAAMNFNPRYFFLLNPDTFVRPGAMQAMVDCLETCPEVGVAGARLVYPDGRFQHSAFSFPGVVQIAFDLWPLPSRLYESRLNGRYSRHLYQPDKDPFPVDLILGAAMMLRRDVAEATGGFDESFHIYCEEVDWCWRIRAAGWEICIVPQAEIMHHGGSSTGQVPAQSVINLWTSRLQLYERHHGRLRLALARQIVARGLIRKARRANSEQLREAYLQAAANWNDQDLNGQTSDPVLGQ